MVVRFCLHTLFLPVVLLILAMASSLAAASRNEVVDELIQAGASWKENTDDDIRTLTNVSFASDDPMQSLDIYFPPDCLDNTTTNTSYPVYIHIHGGGWSRGGKASPFYGGPAMSQAAVKSCACIAVAPGYRLGKYPDFVHDAATAIVWVKKNIEALGGDLNNVFFSGHSAGGHIASLLLLRHSTFLAPYDIPLDFCKGLVLVSGVYDLFNPLKKNLLDSKNKWFFLAYVLPAFGSDEVVRREASPLLLLEPDKNTSVLGKAAMMAMEYTNNFRDSFRAEKDTAASSEACAATATTTTPKVTVEVNTAALPPVLVLNAALDMGLQENGELFSAALSKHTSCKHVLVPGTDHASICWNAQTATEMEQFVTSCLSNSVEGASK